MLGRDATIERLAEQYGRVQAKGGFADKLTRVTEPHGKEFLINDDGYIVEERLNFSVDWSK